MSDSVVVKIIVSVFDVIMFYCFKESVIKALSDKETEKGIAFALFTAFLLFSGIVFTIENFL